MNLESRRLEASADLNCEDDLENKMLKTLEESESDEFKDLDNKMLAALEEVEKDDNENQEWIKRDDNGDVYISDGKLLPNNTYVLNGNVYHTDDKGRIIKCEEIPKISPENPRDNDAQRKAGGKDRRADDQGGHIVGRELNGDGGKGNIVPMNDKINQSDYKRMENDKKKALDEGKDVSVTTDLSYSGDSERPDKITTKVTIDGMDTIYKFDNNVDNSLTDEVPAIGENDVREKLNDTQGIITSIKEEYNEKGDLSKTTVNITYMDSDGKLLRTKVVINNN